MTSTHTATATFCDASGSDGDTLAPKLMLVAPDYSYLPAVINPKHDADKTDSVGYFEYPTPG